MPVRAPSRLCGGLLCLIALIAVQPAFATANEQAVQLQPPACQSDNDAPTDQFTVVIDQPIDSRSCHKGDWVYGHLGCHLQVDGRDFAPGSVVTGKVTEVDHARRVLAAEVCPKRWLHADAGIGLEFDRVKNAAGETASFCGLPMSMPKEFRNGVKEKSIAVSKKGVVEPSRRSEIAPKLTRTSIGVTATLLHNPLVPLVGGVVGAVAPSLVLESCDKDYQSEVKHRRLKGFAAGAVAGMPGGFLINDAVMKGRDEVIKPGTILLMRLAPSTIGNG